MTTMMLRTDEAIPLLKAAGLLLTIEDHGIIVRRLTVPGRFPWIRTLAYGDKLGSLVGADETRHIIRLQTK